MYIYAYTGTNLPKSVQLIEHAYSNIIIKIGEYFRNLLR